MSFQSARKMPMSTESVECEGCTALAYLYLKGVVLAKSRHAAVNVPSSSDVFSGRLSRVVLRANFPSESYAGNVVAITKNFEGTYEFLCFLRPHEQKCRFLDWFCGFFCRSCVWIFWLSMCSCSWCECQMNPNTNFFSWFLSMIFVLGYQCGS